MNEAEKKLREALAKAIDALASVEKERDDAWSKAHAMRDLVNRAGAELNAAIKERDAAQQEARNMQSFAVQNANALNAAQRELSAAKRSYTEQIAELTRALESEKKAHGDALRPERAVDRELREAIALLPSWANWADTSKWPHGHVKSASEALAAWLAAPLSAPDEYTRAAVKFAEAWASPEKGRLYTALMREWSALYDARQRDGLLASDHFVDASKKVEPSAPVSSQPPARVLECWVGEHANGDLDFFDSGESALAWSSRILRAHKVALPVIETVERGEAKP